MSTTQERCDCPTRGEGFKMNLHLSLLRRVHGSHILLQMISVLLRKDVPVPLEAMAGFTEFFALCP